MTEKLSTKNLNGFVSAIKSGDSAIVRASRYGFAAIEEGWAQGALVKKSGKNKGTVSKYVKVGAAVSLWESTGDKADDALVLDVYAIANSQNKAAKATELSKAITANSRDTLVELLARTAPAKVSTKETNDESDESDESGDSSPQVPDGRTEVPAMALEDMKTSDLGTLAVRILTILGTRAPSEDLVAFLYSFSDQATDVAEALGTFTKA